MNSTRIIARRGFLQHSPKDSRGQNRPDARHEETADRSANHDPSGDAHAAAYRATDFLARMLSFSGLHGLLYFIF